MSPAEAQALARRSGARFAFVDCRPGLRDLGRVLGPLIERVRPLRMRDRLRPALTAGGAVRRGGALISGVTALDGIQPNDEGLMLQAAARIADGQVPYSRLLVVLSARPAAAARRACGRPSARRCCVAGRARALRRARSRCWRGGWRVRGGAPRWAALVAWLAAALAHGVSERAASVPARRSRSRSARCSCSSGGRRSPGALAGVAAFWRLEFAAYLGARRAGRVRGARAAPRAAARFALAAVGDAPSLLYAPVVALAGLGPSFDLLVELPADRLLRLPVAAVPARLRRAAQHRARSAASCRTRRRACCCSTCRSCSWLGLAGGLVAASLRDRSPLRVAVAVFALGMAHYLLTRPDVVPHGAARRHGGGAGRLGGAASGRVLAGRRGAAVLALRDRRGRRPPLARAARATTRSCALPVADGVRRARARARGSRARGAPSCRRAFPPGTPTYVATRRADLVTSGYPLLYVLAERPNASRYDIAAPGVVTSAPVQREIVADLERARPPRRGARHLDRHRGAASPTARASRAA